MTLRLVTFEAIEDAPPLTIEDVPDAVQLAHEAEFEQQYERWSVRRRIHRPEEQIKMICAIWFNFGCNFHEEAK